MTTRNHRRRQHGFSLTEAMIALAVLSSGLFALAQFHAEIQASSGETKSQTTALHLAEQKLEELRAQSKTDPLGISNGSDRPATQTGDAAVFARSWSLKRHGSPLYLEVRVTTTWQSRDGDSRQASLSSILATTAPYVQRP